MGLEGEHEFTDNFKISGKLGTSKSEHENPIQTTIIMDKLNVDNYSYDYRGNSRAPVLNYGIDPTNPNGWELAEIRLRPQYVDNDFDTGQIDFNWNIADSIGGPRVDNTLNPLAPYRFRWRGKGVRVSEPVTSTAWQEVARREFRCRSGCLAMTHRASCLKVLTLCYLRNRLAHMKKAGTRKSRSEGIFSTR